MYKKDWKVTELLDMGKELLLESEICREEAALTEKLATGLEQRRLTLSIIGQFKRGKSSLINKMLGKKFLPVGIVPITSVVTKIVKGEPKVFVYFEDGAIREVNEKGLDEYINEQKNPNNIKEVSQVVVQTDGDFLDKGIDLVDTPGVGSIHKNNTKVAYDFIRESDGAVFMISVDSPINEIEIDFLKEAKAYPGSFYFVVNKADIVDQEDLEVYIDYCRSLLANIMGVESDEIKLFPVSAKTGMGVKELEDYVLKDLEERRTEIMDISAAKRMKDIINRGIMRMDMYWTATRMSTGTFEVKFKKLGEAIATEQEHFFRVLDEAKKEGLGVAELTTKLNKLKMALTQYVKDTFNIDYYYEVEGVLVSKENTTASEKELDIFRKRGEEMCLDLDKTLNTLLLYREDDAIVVAKRIRTMKFIKRRLREIKEALNDTQENLVNDEKKTLQNISSDIDETEADEELKAEKTMISEEVPKEKQPITFSDYKEALYISVTNFRGADKIFSKLKNTYREKPLRHAIAKLESMYIGYIIYLLGLAIVSFGTMEILSRTAVVAAIVIWTLAFVIIINPLVYAKMLPRPIKKYIRNKSDMTEEEILIYEAEKSNNAKMDKLLKKYKNSGKF